MLEICDLAALCKFIMVKVWFLQCRTGFAVGISDLESFDINLKTSLSWELILVFPTGLAKWSLKCGSPFSNFNLQIVPAGTVVACITCLVM